MPLNVQLNNSWTALMDLCAREREYSATNQHPKLLRFVSEQIDQLAAELGFSPHQIARREFRAEKSGVHIVRIIRE